MRAIWPTDDPVAPAAPETTTHVEQAEVGGHARDAEHIEAHRQIHPGGRLGHRPHPLIGDGVLLPSDHAGDHIAHLVAIGAGLDDHPAASGADDLPDADRRKVAGCVVHPRPDGRVDRQMRHLDEGLTVDEVGDL